LTKTLHGNHTLVMYVKRAPSQLEYYWDLVFTCLKNLKYPYIILWSIPTWPIATLPWSSTYKTNLKRIFLLQKRIVRILTNSEFRAHTAPLFNELKLLDIYNLNVFYTAKFMFSYHNHLLPPSFQNLFVTSHQIHNYNTRNASSYRSYACNTNVKQFTALFQGPKIWNSLPDDIKNTESYNCFRIGMLNHLLQS
jgi:hypothetical protein